MSTRYVWEKYNVTPNIVKHTINGNDETGIVGELELFNKLVVGNSYIIQNNKFVIQDIITTSDWYSPDLNSTKKRMNTSKYFNFGNGDYLYYIPSQGSNYYLAFFINGGGGPGIIVPAKCYKHAEDDYEPIFDLDYEEWYIISNNNKGDYIGLVSSSSSSAYPKDGISGNYWYVYKGSDTIDPISLTLTVSNNLATLKVNPRTTSYGIISYTYQYQANNGNWVTTASSPTTYTNPTFSIPSETESLICRVLAKDNLGFISTTYVYSNTVTISTSKMYIGTSNVARQATKMYVGVNGIARKVEKGYIGVNGVARRFL